MLAYWSINQAGYMLIGINGTSPRSPAPPCRCSPTSSMKTRGLAALGVIGRASDRTASRSRLRLMLLSLRGRCSTIGFVCEIRPLSAAVQAQAAWYARGRGTPRHALSVFYYARVLKVTFNQRQPLRGGWSALRDPTPPGRGLRVYPGHGKRSRRSRRSWRSGSIRSPCSARSRPQPALPEQLGREGVERYNMVSSSGPAPRSLAAHARRRAA